MDQRSNDNQFALQTGSHSLTHHQTCTHFFFQILISAALGKSVRVCVPVYGVRSKLDVRASVRAMLGIARSYACVPCAYDRRMSACANTYELLPWLLRGLCPRRARDCCYRSLTHTNLRFHVYTAVLYFKHNTV